MADLYQKEQRLIKQLADFGKLVVCYSGGVDSTYLLALAMKSGVEVTAVTIKSESLTTQELDQALVHARELGTAPHVIEVEELAEPKLAANPTNRCYFCKQISYREICAFAQAQGTSVVVDGTNHDDLSDYRPGLKAKDEFGVSSPLAEAGLSKAEIRSLSRRLGLPTWDKPSSPCLNSRIPYGQPITTHKLDQIAGGEQFLRQLGFKDLRVRHHGDLARIEVPEGEISEVVKHKTQITKAFQKLGFLWVSVDLSGFQTGSLNRRLSVET